MYSVGACHQLSMLAIEDPNKVEAYKTAFNKICDSTFKIEEITDNKTNNKLISFSIPNSKKKSQNLNNE